MEYALHSSRTGGAARLAAASLQPAVTQRDGRWRSGGFMEYVRANFEYSGALSGSSSIDAVAQGIQPGQGIQLGDGNDGLRVFPSAPERFIGGIDVLVKHVFR